MNVVDIRKLKDNEIDNKIKEFKNELFNLRFQQALGQLENTVQLKKIKKSIARMKTILNERKGDSK